MKGLWTITPKTLAANTCVYTVDQFHLRNLKQLPFEQKLIYLRGGLKERWQKIVKSFQPKTTSEIIEDEDLDTGLFPILVNVVRSYTPKSYSGKILLFRCIEQNWWVKHDRELGWADLTAQPVEVIDSPGSHNYLPRDNAAFLAKHLQNYLG